jgi:hypothetical protein
MLTLQEVDCLAVLEERDAINESALSVLEDIMVVFRMVVAASDRQ